MAELAATSVDAIGQGVIHDDRTAYALVDRQVDAVRLVAALEPRLGKACGVGLVFDDYGQNENVLHCPIVKVAQIQSRCKIHLMQIPPHHARYGHTHA